MPFGLAFYRFLQLGLPIYAYIKIAGAAKTPKKHDTGEEGH